MVSRQLDWELLTVSALLTLLIVGGVFFFGSMLSDYKVEQLRDDIRQIEVDQRSQALTLQLSDSVETRNCASLKDWVDSSVPEIRDLRKQVAEYESSRKLNNDQYPVLKRRYTNLIIQNLIEIRQLEQNCNQNIVDVIYLYSKECDSCEDQGTILTYYRQKYSDQMVVYPLDTDLGMKHVEFLEKHYNVTDYPTLVIDGEPYEGFSSKQELGEIIQKRLNNTSPNSTVRSDEE